MEWDPGTSMSATFSKLHLTRHMAWKMARSPSSRECHPSVGNVEAEGVSPFISAGTNPCGTRVLALTARGPSAIYGRG